MPGKLSSKAIGEQQAKQEALEAFYRMRSESLRNSHTTTQEGPSGPAPVQPQPPKPAKARRPGILGYIADAYESATGYR